MSHFLTGVGAVLAAIVVTVVASYGADALLQRAGLMGKKLPMTGSTGLIWSILFYRTVFNVLGCFVAAKLAPSHPMAYALGLGVFGTFVSIGGTLANKGGAPAWYGWTLTVLSLPAAYIGGLLATR